MTDHNNQQVTSIKALADIREALGCSASLPPVEVAVLVSAALEELKMYRDGLMASWDGEKV